MDLLKFHHNCFGNSTAGYGVKDLDDSQLAKKKNPAKWCSLTDFAHISFAFNETYVHVLKCSDVNACGGNSYSICMFVYFMCKVTVKRVRFVISRTDNGKACVRSCGEFG